MTGSIWKRGRSRKRAYAVVDALVREEESVAYEPAPSDVQTAIDKARETLWALIEAIESIESNQGILNSLDARDKLAPAEGDELKSREQLRGEALKRTRNGHFLVDVLHKQLASVVVRRARFVDLIRRHRVLVVSGKPYQYTLARLIGDDEFDAVKEFIEAALWTDRRFGGLDLAWTRAQFLELDAGTFKEDRLAARLSLRVGAFGDEGITKNAEDLLTEVFRKAPGDMKKGGLPGKKAGR